MKKDKTYIFEEMSVPKAVMTLAVPTVLGTLVMVIYSMVDTYFVGTLNDSVETAAVTLASPVLLAFNAINNLFGVGGSSMMSRALGRKDIDTVERSSCFGFYCSLVCALVFSLVLTVFQKPFLTLLGATDDTYEATAQYLLWTTSFGAVPAIMNVVMGYFVRAEGASVHASIGTMSGCLLNIVLDPIFILPWGLGMGAAGAGLATFVSNCVACAYFLILILSRRGKGKTNICLNPRKFSFRKTIVLEVFGVGIPAAIQNLLNVVGMTVLNNFTAEYGSDAVAAMGIAQKINMIPLYIAMGFSQGIMPLVSYNYASGNSARMKKTILFSLASALGLLLIMTVVLYAGSGFFVSLFMKSESVVAYGKRFLRGMCLALPFLCLDFMAVGVFQACGKGTIALVFAILRKVVLEIPALIVLNILFPLYGLAYAQMTAEIVMAVAGTVMLIRLFRRLKKRTGNGGPDAPADTPESEPQSE